MSDVNQSVPDYSAALPVREGRERQFDIPTFEFESGETLDRLRIGYVTHGRLNAAGDNAVLLMPGTANTRHSADGYIGPGQAFDTDKYFVIATDAIGAGTSSKPEDGLGGDFPRYTIRDLVNAQHQLVRAGLGLKRLTAVAGASMGAFQALEWAIHHPLAAERAVLMVPAVHAGNIFRSVVRSMIEIIERDPLWQGGRYRSSPVQGLSIAGRVYFPWTVADDYLQQLDPGELERDVQTTVQRTAGWDAWTLIRRYQASASHDITVPFGGDLRVALQQVRMPLLVMPTSTDRLLGIDGARAIAEHVALSDYREIQSQRGHLGWRPVEGSPEMQAITAHIKRFMQESGQ